ncbi:MAG: hypothetical protein K940chlam6_01056 [Chlamydiae bacterium]|nr:hypothetical protein [Chlamydiota bacterium]
MWVERTLNNPVGRRIAIPEALLSADAYLACVHTREKERSYCRWNEFRDRL